MSDLYELVNLESDDEELVPHILPSGARLSVSGRVDILTAIFARVATVTPDKSNIDESMEFSMFEAVEGDSNTVSHVRLTATDGERSVSVPAEGVKVNKEGKVLLKPKKILTILKNAPESSVRIEVVGSTAHITSGQASWNVAVPPQETISGIPDTSGVNFLLASRQEFLAALKAVSVAIATTTARTSLMQVNVSNGYLTGTDGNRVHRQRVPSLSAKLNLDIPLKIVEDLIRALNVSDSDYFEIGSDSKFLAFRIDDDILTASRLLVPFPEIETMVLYPTFVNSQRVSVSRSALIEALKRVRINANPDSAALFLILNPGKKQGGVTPWTMTVKAYDKVGNSSQENIDISYEGGTKSRELALNHKFLFDFLSVYPRDGIELLLGDDIKSKKTPIFVNDEETGFIGLVQQISGVHS